MDRANVLSEKVQIGKSCRTGKKFCLVNIAGNRGLGANVLIGDKMETPFGFAFHAQMC